MELCRRDLYYVEKVSGAPLPVEYLIEKVSETLPDGVAVTGISISSDAERTCRVSLSKPRRASVYVDQYTGEVKGRYERAPFFLTMFRLHRWLLDSMKPEDLGVDVAPRLKTLKVSEPAKRGAGIKVADVAALVDKLKNEAKVI